MQFHFWKWTGGYDSRVLAKFCIKSLLHLWRNQKGRKVESTQKII